MEVAATALLEATPDTAGMAITEWRPGRRPQPITLEQARASLASDDRHAVVCIDLDPAPGAASDVHERLVSVIGPELSLGMVYDLLERDPLPLVSTYCDGEIRSVGMFASRTFDDNGDRGVAFDFAEVLAGDGWLVTCCQETDVVPADPAGPRGVSMPYATHCERFRAAVVARWVDSKAATAGDLGLLILHELTCSYRTTRLALHRWLDEWEGAFFSDRNPRREDLVSLRTMISELRKRLWTLNVPDDEADTAWFRGVTIPVLARRADKHIDTAIADLRELGDTLRTTFDLVQMQISQKQQESSERIGRSLETITSVFLVPALIVGFFGANTRLPGEPEKGLAWAGFVYMVVAMVTGAVAVALLMRHIRRKHDARLAQDRVRPVRLS